MRKRLLAFAAGIVALTGVVANDASAAVNAREDRFTVIRVAGSPSASPPCSARPGHSPSVRAIFQGLFLTRPRSNGIQFARVNRDARSITIQFRQGFTGVTSFRYGIIGEDRNGRSSRGRSRARARFSGWRARS
jgi:hypothetical protein